MSSIWVRAARCFSVIPMIDTVATLVGSRMVHLNHADGLEAAFLARRVRWRILYRAPHRISTITQSSIKDDRRGLEPERPPASDPVWMLSGGFRFDRQVTGCAAPERSSRFNMDRSDADGPVQVRRRLRYQPLPLISLYNRLRRAPFPKTCCNRFRWSGEDQLHGTCVGITNGWTHPGIPGHACHDSDDRQHCGNHAGCNEECPPTRHEVRLALQVPVKDPLADASSGP